MPHYQILWDHFLYHCEVTSCTIVRSLSVPLWDVLDISLCGKVCQWPVANFNFFPDTPDSPINKTDHHNRIEILVIHMSPPFFNWTASTKPWKWAVMYLCVRGQRSCICVLGISFCLCLHEFSIKFCNCSDNVIFFCFSFYDLSFSFMVQIGPSLHFLGKKFMIIQ